MGASESIIVVEQDLSSYQYHDILQSKDSLHLYRISRMEKSNNEDFVEENLLQINMSEGDHNYLYVVVLKNHEKPGQCFSITRHDLEEEAQSTFVEFHDILFPFVNDYPSVNTCEKLQNLIKLKRAYHNWDDVRVAEYLKLSEIKKKETMPRVTYARQNSQHQQETIGLVLKERPSFAKDLFGSIPIQFLTEKHPELFESIVTAIDSIHKTGKDLKDSIDSVTKYTESPVHAAIRLSQDSVLKMLLEKGANHMIPCGHAYPIHIAMKHESKGCLSILLEHDIECLHLKDKKYSGSPLHWAKNTAQIDILAACNKIKLNVLNSNDETALHIMVQRKRLSPVISLVCHGADIDARAIDGKTPLHYAVIQKDINLMRALLILGANPSLRDQEGNIAFDYVDKSHVEYSDVVELFELYDWNGADVPGYRTSTVERTQSLMKEKTGREAVLTLDGGGIRGLVLAEIMIAMESFVKMPLYDLFDWVSGTSTGSFLAMSLSQGKTLRQCQKAYLRLGRSCLTGIRPYPTERVDRFLLDEFGEETKMNQFTYPKVIIPAVMADRRPAQLHLFRNYNAPYDANYQLRDARFPRPPVPADQLMWLAIRSSCSAPSYFRSTGRYLDGGLIANNPTLDVMSEIHNHRQHYVDKEAKRKQVTDLKLILSIGTGRTTLQKLRPIDLYRPSSVWDTPEVMDNLKGFVDLLVDQVSACDNHVMERTKSWCEMIGVEYFRMNPFLLSDIELNESDDTILLPMIVGVRRYIKKNTQSFEKIARILLAEVD